MAKCFECGYYDKEKHHCPLYCQLIRETLNEAIAFELSKLRDEMQHDYDTLNCYLDDSDIGYCACLLEYTKKINNRIEELEGE